MSVQPIDMVQPLNNSNTHINLGIVAAAVSPPLPSIPQNFTGKNATAIISSEEKVGEESSFSSFSPPSSSFLFYVLCFLFIFNC